MHFCVIPFSQFDRTPDLITIYAFMRGGSAVYSMPCVVDVNHCLRFFDGGGSVGAVSAIQ